MPPFEFHVEDLAVVGTLIVLEGLLSADNALVLAMQVRHLPEDQRKKALLYGLVGAFTLRGLGLFVARFIVNLWWLCGIGAGYLIFLTAKHFFETHKNRNVETPTVRTGPGFWQTVVMVELTDIVFALDSILVAVAMSKNIYVIYAGAFLGIVLLRLAATFFIRLLEKYPTLDHVAYTLVGWAGVKLMAQAVELFLVSSGRYTEEAVPNLLPKWAFWGVMAVIVVAGGYFAVRSQRSAEQCAADTSYDEACDDINEASAFPRRDSRNVPTSRK